MEKIKRILLLVLLIVLVYTRFVNLGWGLPYPFHPDERNMAVAIQQLNCQTQNSNLKIQNCFNPHFFAYGQFPLYLGYLGIQGRHLLTGKINSPISFEEAVMALRIISAISSVLVALVLFKILQLIIKNYGLRITDLITTLILIFSPFAIQFAHFGTTESLLMLLYSLIVYISLKYTVRSAHIQPIQPLRLFWLSVVSGLAIATKMSSLIFILVPMFAIFLRSEKKYFRSIITLILITTFFSFLFSPHNLISFKEFISTIRYESDVATGKILVFYTRQFINSVPIIFQFTKIFPYALGWPVLILGILGFFGLSWKKREINLLRFAFLIYFLPNSFLFAKWTRFMAPILPIMLVFALLFLMRINIIKIIIIIIAILPGIAYLSIYQNPDVRFTASNWLYQNMKDNSFVLSEAANVVDIPVKNYNDQLSISNKLPNPNYQIISFNFYDLDTNGELQQELKTNLLLADYIIIPSRRIFMNHDAAHYPKLYDYYQKLFSGNLGFKKIAEFSSFPKITLFGKTVLDFPDEQVEETWSVFDHPVVRIYKRV